MGTKCKEKGLAIQVWPTLQQNDEINKMNKIIIIINACLPGMDFWINNVRKYNILQMMNI